ncbi:MAG: hypothetical protein QOD26_808 [Betaproteobacteria bacterium]|jgi:hypothetical protein|nr:hypothetical protein [Betaproteobacteria bacterium]
MEQEKAEIQALSPRILGKAAHKLGGFAALSRYLGVGDATLAEWIAGRSVPPVETILKAVDLLVDDPGSFLSPSLLERPGTHDDR